MRQVLKRVMLVVVSLCVILTILELLCRKGFFFSRASETHEFANEAASNRFQVLIVGDSFSAEDPTLHPPTFASQLKDYMQQKRAGVLNISAPGYGPPEYLETLRWYEAYSGSFHPNLLMVNYYVGNDLQDTMARLRGYESRVELLQGFGSSLLQRSYLIQTFLESRRRLREKRRLGTIQQELTTADETKKRAVNPYLADLSTNLPQYLMDTLLVQSNEAKQAWLENERILREIHRYAKARHATIVICVFPQTLQLNKSHYEFFKKLGFQMDERYLTSTVPQDLMKRFCAKEQILCIDLLPGFKARSNDEFYLDLDDHWNGAGYTLAFELVRDALEQHRYIQ